MNVRRYFRFDVLKINRMVSVCRCQLPQISDGYAPGSKGKNTAQTLDNGMMSDSSSNFVTRKSPLFIAVIVLGRDHIIVVVTLLLTVPFHLALRPTVPKKPCFPIRYFAPVSNDP